MIILRLALCLLAISIPSLVLAVKPRGQGKQLEGYSFLEFTRDFKRSYAKGSDEYRRREGVFTKSLERIHLVNARNSNEGRSWSSGIHPFMDWTDAERHRLHGYKPAARRDGGAVSARPGFMAALETKVEHRRAMGAMKMNQTARIRQTMVRNQGDCGSCWAISTVEAVEEQLALSGTHVQLSAQALVDCVQNPQHCGGTGGCDGATAELGMQFIRDYGIPLEDEFPYTAKTEECPNGYQSGPWPTSRKRARVTGWNQLPSNRAEPLKAALLQSGPVTIAVDGGNWMDYSRGIFDGCDKDAILSHGVLLKGFGGSGTDKYWLIQNSWGSDWGEHGHIRLRLHDDEDDWCGMDNKPKDGVGCDGGPSEVRVCGMCGLLYDPVQPEGASLEGGDSSVADVSTAAMRSRSWDKVLDASTPTESVPPPNETSKPPETETSPTAEHTDISTSTDAAKTADPAMDELEAALEGSSPEKPAAEATPAAPTAHDDNSLDFSNLAKSWEGPAKDDTSKPTTAALQKDGPFEQQIKDWEHNQQQ